LNRWAIWISRWTAALSIAGGCLSVGADRAVIDRYCVGCHNARMKSGGLALDTLSPERVGQNPEVWEKVVRKLRARYMPPIGLPRPDEHAYDGLVTSLSTSLDAAAAAHPNPGRTDTFRRLNRTEYQNVLRDLLALDVDVSALLPGDESSYGFDNVTVGDLSPTLLERYLSAAEKVSRLAVGVPGRSPGGDTVNLPPDLTQEQHFDDLPLGTRGGLAIHYTFPLDAEYEIRVRLQRDRNEHVEGLAEAHEIELMLDGARLKVFTVKPPASGVDHHAVDQDVNIRIPVKAGPHLVAAAFPKRPSTLLETERQPYQAHFNMDRHPRITPAVYSITVNGPYDAKGPGDTPSRRKIFICTPRRHGEEPLAAGHPATGGGRKLPNSAPRESAAAVLDEQSCANRIFTNLTRRAYRRPVTDADVQVPLKFYKDARAGGSFETGIEMGLRSVLVSPEFLFRVEQDPAGLAPNTAYRISDLELASRLSFFLWSSIPDDQLLDAAIRGKLRTPAVLDQQVRRMLADERSSALSSNFAEQWLYLRNLASTNPDMRVFPDFDDNLRQAFRRETELFFESILHEDRSVLDLLRANYSFVNERLAKHYGIPNVYGSRFRRVTFDEGSTRGGLLRQGSILTVSSYANRTSPVLRGKWILANILGTAPPPPPPGAGVFKENSGVGKSVTMRVRLAEHRANPACSGCHQLMDPIGFSLENYDAVGRWRTHEGGKTIDASGSLPDGTKFEGVAGLQKALLSRPDLFAATITEKLLTYALGRGVETYDAPSVRKVVAESRTKDFRFSSLIQGIVSSTPFQMRRSQ
jgi:hypothetical protein